MTDMHDGGRDDAQDVDAPEQDKPGSDTAADDAVVKSIEEEGEPSPGNFA